MPRPLLRGASACFVFPSDYLHKRSVRPPKSQIHCKFEDIGNLMASKALNITSSLGQAYWTCCRILPVPGGSSLSAVSGWSAAALLVVSCALPPRGRSSSGAFLVVCGWSPCAWWSWSSLWEWPVVVVLSQFLGIYHGIKIIKQVDR